MFNQTVFQITTLVKCRTPRCNNHAHDTRELVKKLWGQILNHLSFLCWHDLIAASRPECIKKQRSLLAGEQKPASVRFPTFTGIVFRRLCSKVEKFVKYLLLWHQHSGHRSHPRSATSTMHPVISTGVRDMEIREGTRGGRSKFLSGNRPRASWCSLGAF